MCAEQGDDAPVGVVGLARSVGVEESAPHALEAVLLGIDDLKLVRPFADRIVVCAN